MTEVDVCRQRLAQQFLTTKGPPRASDVVRTMGAVQAQDYSGAKWALSQRARAASDEAIERELTDGRILRTHILRPTWHFVAPEDIRWMLALTGPRVSTIMSYYNKQLGLDRAVFDRSNAAIAKALSGGHHLTRAELKAVLVRARIGPLTGQQLGRLMMQAELEQVVCSGHRRGKQSTYALMDERVRKTPARDRDDALGELTRRYFTTRGPATPHDFAWWSGLTLSDAKRGIQIVGKELEQIVVGKTPNWRAANARPSKSVLSAHLLPNYDEYFIGYKNRSAIGKRLGSSALAQGGDALVAYVVAVDGQLVGGWKRALTRTGVIVTLNLISPLKKAERERVAAAATRFGEFLGLPARVSGE